MQSTFVAAPSNRLPPGKQPNLAYAHSRLARFCGVIAGRRAPARAAKASRNALPGNMDRKAFFKSAVQNALRGLPVRKLLTRMELFLMTLGSIMLPQARQS